jgi:hypothetical protein
MDSNRKRKGRDGKTWKLQSFIPSSLSLRGKFLANMNISTTLSQVVGFCYISIISLNVHTHYTK